MFTYIDKLTSAVHNNIQGGLAGYHTNFSISTEQLQDAIIQERLLIIRERFYKGVLNPIELYLSINCIPIDCKSIEKCTCKEDTENGIAHFEIPQLITDFGTSCISYIGSTDKEEPFTYYFSQSSLRNHKYRKRGRNRPYIWIDLTPNENGMLDGYVYNAPLLKQISITAAFKDIRQLQEYSCCSDITGDTMTSLDSETIDRVTKKMLTYYRHYYMQPLPNNQSYTPA